MSYTCDFPKSDQDIYKDNSSQTLKSLTAAMSKVTCICEQEEVSTSTYGTDLKPILNYS
jgi:hypothetical protein